MRQYNKTGGELISIVCGRWFVAQWNNELHFSNILGNLYLKATVREEIQTFNPRFVFFGQQTLCHTCFANLFQRIYSKFEEV